MTLKRWEPWRDLARSHERFNRLFDDASGGPGNGGGANDLRAATWAPAVDMYEKDGNLIIKADLPGLDPNQVELRVEQNTLLLRGERKFENEVKHENYHRVERSYGSFIRSFALPRSVDPGKIAAEYKNGVLVITLPKREEAKPKTVKINVATA